MRIKVLKVITYIAIVVWLLSVCVIDSNSWIPYITCGVSSLWILLIVVANCREAK